MSALHGRVALITGGGKGVGAGIGRVFAAHGIRVCLGYNSSEELAHKTLADIISAGGDAFLFKGDISNRAQIEAMVGETVARYGALDILVNNAALQPNRFIRQYDRDTFTKLWEINIGGYFRATQACLPYLKQSDNARIINISSIHGKRPTMFDPGYAMTKGAIRMFTREAALELARYDITVNTIDLGACHIEGKTGNYPFRIYWPEELRKNNSVPLGRIAKPEDAGELALYLAGPGASNTTGAGIRLDGGMTRV